MEGNVWVVVPCLYGNGVSIVASLRHIVSHLVIEGYEREEKGRSKRAWHAQSVCVREKERERESEGMKVRVSWLFPSSTFGLHPIDPSQLPSDVPCASGTDGTSRSLPSV